MFKTNFHRFDSEKFCDGANQYNFVFLPLKCSGTSQFLMDLTD